MTVRPEPASLVPAGPLEPTRRVRRVRPKRSYSHKPWSRRFGVGRALSLVLLIVLVGVRIWDPAIVETIRLRTFDSFQVMKPRASLQQKPIVIVDIDEASLHELGQWPWPRTRIAEMVTRLTEAGAVAIAFDIIFPEPDRLSPNLMADTLPQLDEATRAALRALPSNDQVLADAMRASRVILGQTALVTALPADGNAPRSGFAVRGPDPSQYLKTYPGLLRSVPVIEDAAAGRGLFTIEPERDGIVRRIPLIMEVEGGLMPALSLDILRVLTGAGAIFVKSEQAGVEGVLLPGFELPTDPYGRVWVHFSPHDPGQYVPAKDVLDGTMPPDRVANKIVLVGTSAIALFDNKTTPLDRSIPGVEIHAQVLESALTHQMLSSPTYATIVELLVTIAVSIAIIIFAPILGATQLLAFGAAVAAFLAAASWYRFVHSGILLDATFPLASSFLIYLTLVFTNYFREQVDRHRIRSAFGQYLSPALVEQLANSPDKLKLGGEERDMTIMFSDVRGFTSISESYKHDPQGLTALMNRFLTPLTNAILDRKGTIDKYMGDAIMAFWNAPLDDPKQEANACAAALDMLVRLGRVNDQRRDEAEHGGHEYIPLSVGVGLNTGRCVVGNMGSNLRFDYSVLGDTVNLASRLEGQSKFYGVTIILGASTARAVAADYATLEIDLIQVKGKSEPETVSTLVGGPDIRASSAFAETAASHHEMIARYRAQDWDGAAAQLALCRERAEAFALSGLYDLYEERIAAFRIEPPQAGWTGVYVATSK